MSEWVPERENSSKSSLKDNTNKLVAINIFFFIGLACWKVAKLDPKNLYKIIITKNKTEYMPSSCLHSISKPARKCRNQFPYNQYHANFLQTKPYILKQNKRRHTG